MKNVPRIGSNTYTRSAAELRDSLMNYFISSEGAVPWQFNYIRST